MFVGTLSDNVCTVAQGSAQPAPSRCAMAAASFHGRRRAFPHSSLAARGRLYVCLTVPTHSTRRICTPLAAICHTASVPSADSLQSHKRQVYRAPQHGNPMTFRRSRRSLFVYRRLLFPYLNLNQKPYPVG